MKTNGFNNDETHPADVEEINKLLAPVSVAFVCICKAGYYWILSTQSRSKHAEEDCKVYSNT